MAAVGNQNARKHGLSRILRLAKAGIRDRRAPKGLRGAQHDASKFTSLLFEEVEEHYSGQPVPREAVEAVMAAGAWDFVQLAIFSTLRQDDQKTRKGAEPQFGPEKRLYWLTEYAKAADRKADRIRQLTLTRPPTDEFSSPDTFDAEIVQHVSTEPLQVSPDESTAGGENAPGDAMEASEPLSDGELAQSILENPPA
jgi:hypothetical protein